jgi:hypothetical protein
LGQQDQLRQRHLLRPSIRLAPSRPLRQWRQLNLSYQVLQLHQLVLLGPLDLSHHQRRYHQANLQRP